MSDIVVVTNLTAIEQALATYALNGSFNDWTKAGGSAAYDSLILANKYIASPFDDQSVRFKQASNDYRYRVSLCSVSQKGAGVTPRMSWEFVPTQAAAQKLIDTFSTDFGTPDWDTSKWQQFGATAPTISGGTLNLTQSDNSGLRSVNAYDMRGKSVTVRVPRQQTNANASTGFAIATSDALTMYWAMYELNGSLRFFNNGALAANTSYNATNHLWLRIRFSDDGLNVYYDTSPNGTTWTQQFTGAVSNSVSALYLYLKPIITAGGPYNFVYDDVSLLINGGENNYRVVENGTVAFVASNTPAVGNELRVQIEKVSGNYVGKYLFRATSGDSESTAHTSVLSSATLQTYFPLFAKAEIWDNNGIVRDFQMETTQGPFTALSYVARSQPNNVVVPLIIASGQPVPELGSTVDNWVLDFERAVSSTGIVAKTYIAADASISAFAILSQGVTSGGSATFDVLINGVSVLEEPLEVNFANAKPEVEIPVTVQKDDLLEVECLSTNRTLVRPIGLRVTMEEAE